MTVHTELEKRIALEQGKVGELRNEIERREAFIQGLQEALKMLPKETPTGRRRAAGPLRSRGDVQKARQLLSTETRALHISDILRGIGKENTKQNRASLASSLARYARRNEIFRREGPNEFSLIIKESAKEVTAIQEDQNGTAHEELPAAFGAES
jgi:hypothetical protein